MSSRVTLYLSSTSEIGWKYVQLSVKVYVSSQWRMSLNLQLLAIRSLGVRRQGSIQFAYVSICLPAPDDARQQI